MRDPVQEQLEAYNARELDTFLACYADDVVIAAPDGEVLTAGIEDMRSSYGALFDRTVDLHVDVASRLRAGSWVVDEEHVRQDGKRFHVIVAYQLEAQFIKRVLMLR